MHRLCKEPVTNQDTPYSYTTVQPRYDIEDIVIRLSDGLLETFEDAIEFLLSPRAKPISDSGIQVEPFIANQFTPSLATPDINHIRQRMQPIPNGYILFRPDSVSSERILFIPNGCWTSEAFQVNLYSYAIPQC
jgi:hypothetical protein